MVAPQGERAVAISLQVEGAPSFTKQVGDAAAAVDKLNKSTAGLPDSMASNSLGMLSFLTHIENISRGAHGLNVMSLTLATTLGSILANAIQNLAGQLFNMNTGVVAAAGRFDTLLDVVIMLGNRAGYTTEFIQEQVNLMRLYGVEAGVASNLLAQLVRQNLDLSYAYKLARVAQDAGVISGENSSAVLQRITYGITEQNTVMLRAVGLDVKAEEARAKLAETLGKSVNQLTIAERQQAMINAVLEEGEKIVGAYDTAMDSAFKKWGSYARVANDLAIAVGSHFQNASLETVNSLTTLTERLRYAIEEQKTGYEAALILTKGNQDLAREMADAAEAMGQEITIGGELNQTFETMGAILAGLVSVFGDFTEDALDKLIGFTDDADTSLSNFAMRTFEHGVNIVTQLAAGIVQGGASVLVWAMNWISSVLESWLAPGSPPKVAPDLPLWGTNAMEQFLIGFTKADFGILGQLQGTLQNALGVLVKRGDLEKTAQPGVFKDISEELIKSLDKGALSPAFLGKIGTMFGDMGSAVVALTQKQFDLALSMREVEEAEKALEAARNKEDAATAKVVRQMEEYNRLYREGASREVLEQKRKEFKLSREELAQAKEARLNAEENLETRQENIGTLKDEAELQEEIVKQLIKLNDSFYDMTPNLGKLGEGIKNASAGINTSISGLMDGVASKITSRFEDIKTQVETIVSTAFENAFGEGSVAAQKIKEFGESWQRFTQNIGNFWTTYVQPILTYLETNGIISDDSLVGLGELIAKTFIGIFLLDKLWRVILVVSSVWSLLANGLTVVAALFGVSTVAVAGFVVALMGAIFVGWALVSNWRDVTDTLRKLTALFFMGFIEYFKEWISVAEEVVTALSTMFENLPIDNPFEGVMESWTEGMGVIKDTIQEWEIDMVEWGAGIEDGVDTAKTSIEGFGKGDFDFGTLGTFLDDTKTNFEDLNETLETFNAPGRMLMLEDFMGTMEDMTPILGETKQSAEELETVFDAWSRPQNLNAFTDAEEKAQTLQEQIDELQKIFGETLPENISISDEYLSGQFTVTMDNLNDLFAVTLPESITTATDAMGYGGGGTGGFTAGVEDAESTITNIFIPTLDELRDTLSTDVTTATNDFYDSVFKTNNAIINMSKYIGSQTVPLFRDILKNALDKSRGSAGGVAAAIGTIAGAAQSATWQVNALLSALGRLKSFLDKFKIGVFQEHSPSMFEHSVAMTNQAMNELASVRLPQLRAQLQTIQMPVTMMNAGNETIVNENHFELGVYTNQNPSVVTDSYRVLELMAGE